jgi:5-(hydroxymethyl)furfural/furfural oxidase
MDSTENPAAEDSFDVIIVGAGPAGCALAGRLSEMRDRKVLLIEAGPDVPPGEEPQDIRDAFPVSMSNSTYHWPGLAAQTASDTPVRPFIQGFGVGGGSNINGMIAFRGFPEDYDEWRDCGAAGWGWDDVLPHFKAVETDLNFAGPLHGDAGPIPVRRVLAKDWGEFGKTFAGALAQRGFPLVEDGNADFRDGVVSVPMSSFPDRRVSASMAYLNSRVRSRPNLTIIPNTRVERIIIDDGHARGVISRRSSDQGIARFASREVLVTCGALLSPTLLQRSGIGPGRVLQSVGIAVRVDLPGVGLNLRNRAKLELALHLPRASVQPATQRGLGQNCLRYSSKVAGCPRHDMGIKVINRTAWHALGRRIGALGIGLYKPFSTGSVELTSPDSEVSPRVRFNALGDSRDLQRLADGLRLACEILSEGAVAARRNEVFLPPSRVAAGLSRSTRFNGVRATAIAALLNSSMVRRRLLKPWAIDMQQLVLDPDSRLDLVRQHFGLGWHVCGTCKMGRADDRLAVVDSVCRVRGVGGLRVADASVFPTLAGEGGLQLTVLMAAEKVADAIKRQWRSRELAA